MYAAVIPLFCKSVYGRGRQPVINGDGDEQPRFYVSLDNAVQANMRGLFTDRCERAFNQIYNMACGEQTSLTQFIKMLRDVSGKSIDAIYGPERVGM